MADQLQSGNNINIGLGDTSQRNVYGISQRGVKIMSQSADFQVVDKAAKSVVMDSEVANLLIWLAEQQGISPEVALKKAVATAAYIYDITTSQGGKLLVKRKDNSVGEIVLK